MAKKAQEIRDLSDDEIQARYLDEQKVLFKLINERAQSRKQFDKPHRVREKRKEIARILTVQRQKQLAKG